MVAKNNSNELHLTRLFDAPVKAVWEAWTDPAQSAQWWGPRGFTTTSHRSEVRTGGEWHYTMHGPDGTDFETVMKFVEVEKYAKLVYDHGGHDDRPALFRVTVLFKPVGDQTLMDMRMVFPSPEAFDRARKGIQQHNGESTWDRLAEFLNHGTHHKDTFVINRSFDAPLATMFEMWTNPKHFAKWLPPTGAEMEFKRADIRAGGTSFYAMKMGPMTMHGRAEYLKVEKPGTIVYVQQFCDENEKPSRHPLAPTFPASMLTTVTLTAEGPDRTRVTVRWEPQGKLTAAEIETFLKMRGGMAQGWGGSFEKLESYLEQQ